MDNTGVTVTMMDSGRHDECSTQLVIYVAIGDRCRREVRRSIETLRRYGQYSGKVLILSNEMMRFDDGRIEVMLVPLKTSGSAAFRSRFVKTQMHRFSEFRDNIFLDTDTVVRKPIQSLWNLLSGGGVWMALDQKPLILSDAMEALEVVPGWISLQEIDFTKRTVPSWVCHFNSGLILWRQSEYARDLFETWHAEWFKFQRADQIALMRATYIVGKRHGQYPGVLPARIHFTWPVHLSTPDKAVVYHYFDQKASLGNGFWWRGAFSGAVRLAKLALRRVGGRAVALAGRLTNIKLPAKLFAVAAGNQKLLRAFARYCGLLVTGHEISLLLRELIGRGACRMLVFGAGNDSRIWTKLNKGGETVFLEDNEQRISAIKGKNPKCRIEKVCYWTKVGHWRQEIQSPDLLLDLPSDVAQGQWDIIYVDAPTGFNDDCPGRLQSIYTAAKLAGPNTKIFIHDCDRQVEMEAIKQFVGFDLHKETAGTMLSFQGVTRVQLAEPAARDDAA